MTHRESRVLPDPEIDMRKVLREIRGLMSVLHQEACEVEAEIERMRSSLTVLLQRLDHVVSHYFEETHHG